DEASYDEGPYALAVARRFGSAHQRAVFTAADAARAIPDLGGLLDEPLGDPSFLPTVSLARRARESVTVLLGGDGGDELWCGSPAFVASGPAEWINRLPGPALRGATRLVEALPSSARYGSVDFLLKQFVRGLGCSPDASAQILMGGFTAGERARVLGPAVR